MKILTRTVVYAVVVGIVFGARILLANNPPCNFSASPAGPYCPGATVTFTATPPDWCVGNNAITNYAWTVDGGTVVTDSGSVITILVGNTLGTGELKVSLKTFDLNSYTSGDNPCTQPYDIVCGTVNASPAGTDMGDGTHVYCMGQAAITLNATACGTPTWGISPACSNGCNFSSDGTSATFTPAANFTGTATIKAIWGTCTGTATIVVVGVASLMSSESSATDGPTNIVDWASSGVITVTATLDPNITSGLPSCYSLTKNGASLGQALSTTVNKSTPGTTTIIATAGTSSKTNTVIVFKATISPLTMAATESLDSGTFTCTVTPTITGLSPTYQWLSDAGNGAWPATAGNSPALNYSAATASSTILTGTRWFAKTPSHKLLTDGENCTYNINCQVTISGMVFKANDPAGLSVTVNTDSETHRPAFDNWESIQRQNTAGTTWVVTGIGSFHRTAPVVSVNVPDTSQFYNKLMTHENTHVHQWTSETPWKDLFDANALYLSTLSTLTSDLDEADLLSKIYMAVLTKTVADKITAKNTRCAREQAAFDAENAEEPHFLEYDDAEWKRAYSCP